jgi:MFS family permease
MRCSGTNLYCGKNGFSASLNYVPVRDNSAVPNRSKSINNLGNEAGDNLGNGVLRSADGAQADGRAAGRHARFGPLRERNFRVFYAGYATSLLGSAMSRIALTFAVLEAGHTAADLGFVFAASVVPQVLFMLGGGVLADRLGRRRVMLVTDVSRLGVQGALATALLLSSPPLWLFVVLSGLLAAGEGFFNPALGGLRAEIAPPGLLPDANALLGMAQSGAAVLGPALGGGLVALASPALAIALDAASYGVSALALARLAIRPARQPHQSPRQDLSESWAEFRAQTWLWLTTVQFALFNLFTWAPYLLLGPILARDYLGGATAWGIISAAYAGGAVLGGLVMVGRRPRRPLVVGVIGTFGFGVPCLLLALHAPASAVAAGALAAGCGSSVYGTLEATVQQQRVPASMLSRMTALTLTGSFALGSMGYAVIGSVAGVLGPARLLEFAAAYATLSSCVVLAAPAIRSVRWQDEAPSPAVPAADS